MDGKPSIVTSCAWCGRYHVGDRWVTPVGSWPTPLVITHGICPECTPTVFPFHHPREGGEPTRCNA